MQLELGPRHDLGQLLERAEPAGQGDEPVGQLGHPGLALVQGLDDVQRVTPGWASSRSTSRCGMTPMTSPPASSAASASAPISPTRPPP